MWKKLGLAIVAIMIAPSVNANVKDKDVAKCSAISGDLARLECFDNLARSNNLDGRQVQKNLIKGKGKWRVTIDINPVDDSTTVTLMLDADTGKNRFGESVYLVSRCKSNTTDLYIGWGNYLGNKANVLTRVGEKKASTSRWSISTDSKATFHQSPIPFLKEMLKSNKLIAQVTPYNENPVTAIFDTSGLKNAIKPLRKTCSW